MNNRIGIIGGGAAGMMAAITAARAGADVTLIEGNDRLGKKILATGNGKCNLGNEKLDLEEYHTGCPDRLEYFLKQFGTEDTVSFFRGIGLLIKSRNGYLYPMCEQAAAVLDVLRYEVAALGVKVITQCKIEWIEKNEKASLIHVGGAENSFRFDRVILACGGCAAPKTGSDGSGFLLAGKLGHGLVPTVPALVQLRCREDYFKAVAGVRTDALLTVMHQGKQVAAERGELMLTDYGISGIPVFQLSRAVNYLLLEKREVHNKKRHDKGDLEAEVEVKIDFLPDYTEEVFSGLCADRDLRKGERTVEEFFTGLLHKKLMMLFIKMAGLKPTERAADADGRKMRQVYQFCRQLSVHVTGSNSYDNAQVCAGGVPLEEVTHKLESKKVPGIYLAGEMLDVDGKCGGYNLQWAWCSGYLAGMAAAEVKHSLSEKNAKAE